MAKQKRQRTPGERVAAAAPGLLGLGLIAAGLGYAWYASTYPPHQLNIRVAALLVAGGVVALGYWAFANDGGGYNF